MPTLPITTRPTNEELTKQFSYFAHNELQETGEFYRFWATGRVTKHFYNNVIEVCPRIGLMNLILLPQTVYHNNDSIVTTFIKALELRELLLIELRQKGSVNPNEEQLNVSSLTTLLPSRCEYCGRLIEGAYYKAHVKHDGPVRDLCQTCAPNIGFCGQQVSSNNH